MNKAFSPALAVLIFLAGIAMPQDANARQEPIGRFLYGMECDESLAGYAFDDGQRIYYCDGREWYIVGNL